VQDAPIIDGVADSDDERRTSIEYLFDRVTIERRPLQKLRDKVEPVVVQPK
jgi:hypothetical protein